MTEDIRQGRVRAKNLFLPQRAVFLDRDGTINEYRGFLTDIEEFHLLPGIGEAIRLLNRMGFLVIVVTNQPVIARGEITPEQLEEIHRKMETLLGAEGAYVDAIYYCPHHPDSGFAGEIPELKKVCDCRKPKPGMLLRAADDYHIDLAASWMVGDQKMDIQAGKNAGCRAVGVWGAQGEDGTFPDLALFCQMAFGAAAPATGESDMRNGYIGKETEQILRSLLDRYPALEKCETQIKPGI